MKRRLPKYEWHVLTPHNHTAGQLPRRHAVMPGSNNGSVRALCGGTPEKDAYQVTGPKTIEKHPICGRCEAQIQRSALMLGV